MSSRKKGLEAVGVEGVGSWDHSLVERSRNHQPSQEKGRISWSERGSEGRYIILLISAQRSSNSHILICRGRDHEHPGVSLENNLYKINFLTFEIHNPLFINPKVNGATKVQRRSPAQRGSTRYFHYDPIIRVTGASAFLSMGLVQSLHADGTQ